MRLVDLEVFFDSSLWLRVRLHHIAARDTVYSIQEILGKAVKEVSGCQGMACIRSSVHTNFFPTPTPEDPVVGAGGTFP
eukprot:3467716-Amphidinium_carterae.1